MKHTKRDAAPCIGRRRRVAAQSMVMEPVCGMTADLMKADTPAAIAALRPARIRL